jgi:hypothetical protein
MPAQQGEVGGDPPSIEHLREVGCGGADCREDGGREAMPASAAG